MAGRLADFLRQRLAPFQPEVVVVPARKRGTPFSPDDPDVVRSAHSAAAPEPEPPPAGLAELVTAREAARSQGDWALADKLRAEIIGAGWQVQDTHAGPVLVPADRPTGVVRRPGAPAVRPDG